MPPHGEMGRKLSVVGPLARSHAIETKIITADRDGLTRLELGDPLEAPLGFADDAEQRDSKSEMRERGSPGRPR